MPRRAEDCGTAGKDVGVEEVPMPKGVQTGGATNKAKLSVKEKAEKKKAKQEKKATK